MPILSLVRWPQGIRESLSRAAKRTTSATCSGEAGFATAEGVISSTTYSEQREGSAETWEAPMTDSRREAKLEIALIGQPQQEEVDSCKSKVEKRRDSHG